MTDLSHGVLTCKALEIDYANGEDRNTMTVVLNSDNGLATPIPALHYDTEPAGYKNDLIINGMNKSVATRLEERESDNVEYRVVIGQSNADESLVKMYSDNGSYFGLSRTIVNSKPACRLIYRDAIGDFYMMQQWVFDAATSKKLLPPMPLKPSPTSQAHGQTSLPAASTHNTHK